jgi:protein involved in polysaccharide export with SLBB domain
VIQRTNDDYSKEMISFNPIEIIQGKQADIVLQKNDEIIIGNSKDFKEDYFVTIQGQVKKPSQYPYFENQSLKDLIFAAGGFAEGATVEKIEVASRLDLAKFDANSNELAQVITINSEKDLALKGNDIKLKPWDIVTVRTKPGYKSQVKVQIAGEVLYPGTYVLSSSDEKVSNVLQRAGGLTHSAFIKGVSITRLNKANILKDTSDIYFKKIKQQINDTSSTASAEYLNPTVKIGLDVEKLLKDTNSIENIYLQEGDIINVPKIKREIKVSGEVLFPTEVVYVDGENLNYYIDRAGGFTDNAQKNKVYVLKANGIAAKTKKFLFFKSYPKVEAGSEILVPRLIEKNNKKLSTAETVGIASAIGSLAGIIIAIINITK